MTLLDLENGEKGVILKVKGRGAFRRRIIEMGFLAGKAVEVIKSAPLQDPIEYVIMGYNLSLRRSEARLIEVMPLGSHVGTPRASYGGFASSTQYKNGKKRPGKEINVALVGNPNSGKTTFFNHASGSRERVGNFSGVTVDSKEAVMVQDGYRFHITDLPGTYSISAYSPDELFVQKYIAEKLPDVVINVVDASNLERNLYLTTQLIDMDIRVVMVLNMYDELQRRGDQLDHESLGRLLGIPIVPAISSRGWGIRKVFSKVIAVYEDREEAQRHIHIHHGPQVEDAIQRIQRLIKQEENKSLTDLVSSRFLAIRLLEKDKEAVEKIRRFCQNAEAILDAAAEQAQGIEKEFHDSPETVITDLKYGFIAGALKETLQPTESVKARTSQAVDTLLTHKWFGFPVFLFFMWAMFSATFFLGSYPMEWIEDGVALLSSYLDQQMATGPFKDLLINGVISGVGGVLVFLPNIMLLFFFISIMEDTGYMSRAVFIMDKLMHKIGLHGKSFIPLLMGFGCNVPAIMATRTLANRNDRMITMLINPFMSCSARLPIYVLFISAFFAEYQGSVLFLIYLLGVLAAIGMAVLLKKTLFRADELPFVMELPPYRIPTAKATTTHMWNKAVQYLRKISGIILIASIIIWALGYFPGGAAQQDEMQARQLQATASHQAIMQNLDPGDAETLAAFEKQLADSLRSLETTALIERQEKSYIGRLGKALSPLMAPLGFDWKMTISIISGIAAKEIVVSTLAVLYHADESVQARSPSLIEKLQNQTHPDGKQAGEKVFNPVVAMSFMVFVLLYFPCIGVFAAITRESGHWKWGLFTVAYTTLLAWVASFIVYQAGSLLFL